MSAIVKAVVLQCFISGNVLSNEPISCKEDETTSI